MPTRVQGRTAISSFGGGQHGLALAVDRRMGKYAVAWLLGVPLSVLVVIYLLSQTVCG
jgi:hypothetical protein